VLELLDFEGAAYEKGKEDVAISLFDILDVETISARTKLALERVKELKEQYFKNDTEE